ncbi:hypothetical protein GH714_020046 [Hevea brasiliensis]|uniref:Uncharacterized protein n=1 Tax=Hevea brasiliensis TaxID=3981 RepID=A0A6A6K7Q6_HEVBR|nr:hypothetical protein GH714_020046 [Hevea brasiliensis]
MGTFDGKWDDYEYSVIGDKGKIGFIDYQEDQSVCSCNPIEESPIVTSHAPLKMGNLYEQLVGLSNGCGSAGDSTKGSDVKLDGVGEVSAFSVGELVEEGATVSGPANL